MYSVEKSRIVSSEFLEADVRGQQNRGNRKRWIDVIKYNMEDLRLNVEDVKN